MQNVTREWIVQDEAELRAAMLAKYGSEFPLGGYRLLVQWYEGEKSELIEYFDFGDDDLLTCVNRMKRRNRKYAVGECKTTKGEDEIVVEFGQEKYTYFFI